MTSDFDDAQEPVRTVIEMEHVFDAQEPSDF